MVNIRRSLQRNHLLLSILLSISAVVPSHADPIPVEPRLLEVRSIQGGGFFPIDNLGSFQIFRDGRMVALGCSQLGGSGDCHGEISFFDRARYSQYCVGRAAPEAIAELRAALAEVRVGHLSGGCGDVEVFYYYSEVRWWGRWGRVNTLEFEHPEDPRCPSEILVLAWAIQDFVLSVLDQSTTITVPDGNLCLPFDIYLR